MSTITSVTADQLLQMPDDGFRYELVGGELRKMPPAGWEHGAIGGKLFTWLGTHVEERALGRVFLAETGFLLARDPDTVRAPDIAFVHKDHLPAQRPGEAFWPGAPDLVVEVVSPGDTVYEVDEKVKEWLDAGAMAVWIVDPKAESVTIHRAGSEVRVLTENDELDGQDVLPDFRRRVGDIFADA